MTYQVTLDYDDYFKCSNSIKAEKIEILGDSILFYTDEESLKYLNDNNICYMVHEDKKTKKKKMTLHFGGVIFGLIFVAFLLIMNFYRVSEIKFSGIYPINDAIGKMIEDGYKSILVFDFHSNNYEDLSHKVRMAFKEYEWISIAKNGSIIEVNIEPTKTQEYPNVLIPEGNIVAKKDGVVSQFIAFDGKLLVEDNMYVKAGDILIEGKVLGARGYVLAYTYEEIMIKVPKSLNSKEFTGKSNKYYEVEIFNRAFPFLKESNFVDKEIVSSHIFTIPYLLRINKIVEYEKDDIIYVYDKDEAVEYAKSMVEASFENAKILPEEKIVLQEVLLTNENEDFFQITLMVKKEESIGEFVGIE